MAQRAAGRDRLIECEFCGEKYSATYKRCPFCNGDGTGRWDALDEEMDLAPEDGEAAPRGGKRLLGGTGGGSRGPGILGVLGTVLSLALIAAAVCIVITVVKPLLGGRATPSAGASAAPSQPAESQPAESQAPQGAAPGEAVQPAAPAEPGATQGAGVAVVETPAPVSTAVPGPGGVTGFTLSKEDFSFFTKGESYRVSVTFQPQGAVGTVSWISADPAVATVDADGRVTAVGRGTVKITASVEGVGERQCIVRCNLSDAAESAAPSQSAAPQSTPAPSQSSGLSLNRTDFTLLSKGETFRMRLTGSDAAVTWKSSNANVASIDGDGLVTAVGEGTCTITATVDGQTLECIARCRF